MTQVLLYLLFLIIFEYIYDKKKYFDLNFQRCKLKFFRLYLFLKFA